MTLKDYYSKSNLVRKFEVSLMVALWLLVFGLLGAVELLSWWVYPLIVLGLTLILPAVQMKEDLVRAENKANFSDRL